MTQQIWCPAWTTGINALQCFTPVPWLNLSSLNTAIKDRKGWFLYRPCRPAGQAARLPIDGSKARVILVTSKETLLRGFYFPIY
jgi:hypothetical protein